MKASLISAVLAILPFVFARNCIPGVVYCGQTLIDIGAYHEQLFQANHCAGAPRTDHDIRSSLYYCVGGDGGVVNYMKVCSTGCKDNGPGNNDSCR
ncbi:uncharacterized protein G6M90_00g030540 [Metarhizium brunneum]|uniref:Uncharacterized protein n=2 Tax=Opisthokonta TaxID=33154 RepID=A0A7D5YT70_9HYPO